MRAFIGNVECRVDVDKDLGESWAVSVVPPGSRPGASGLLVVKLQGQDREKITRGALEILQKAGAIDRFEIT